jgi:IS5 family transposase
MEKRPEVEGRRIGFGIDMRPGKRRALPNTPEGRLQNMLETVKAHLRPKAEHPFRVIKLQIGFQKVFYRGIEKNDHKLKMLFALANL